MINRLPSIGIVCLLVIVGFVGFFNFESENAHGTLVGGPISPPGEIWDLAGSPYIVVGDVIVLSGAILTIEPGVEVKFDGYYSIYVDGNLSAVGNKISGINITSNKITPLLSDWRNIQINSTGHAEIKYCDITYGSCGIYLDSSSNNNITNNKVHSNDYSGIYLDSSSNNNITSNQIYNQSDSSGDGIYLYSSSNNNITSNQIYNHSNGVGILLDSSSNNNIINNNITSNYEGIYLLFSSNSNMINGNNIFLNKGAGIYFWWFPSNNIITNNNVSSNSYCGIYLAYSSNNIITNNTVLSNNEWGIWLYRTSNNSIANNNITNDGVFIKGNQLSHYNTHTIPDNNTVNDRPLFYYKDSNGINIDGISLGQVILANCTNVNVKNLQINKTDVGIELAYSMNINITGNNISNNDVLGIYLDSASNTKITNNNISSNELIGIILYSSSNIDITNNDISSNLNDGIKSWFCSSVDIINNNISSNKMRGITIHGPPSSYNSITNNNISSNLEEGIYLRWSSNHTITNNNISNNGEGIQLDFQSNDNTIADNNVSNNKYGIRVLSSSNNNMIISNKISSNNVEGINLSSSSNNKIYHNNIINNLNQAYDDTNFGNQWDNGYPSGGNYWSDYDGVDYYKGPNQDILGGDGIGDTPYAIDDDSRDNYPLVVPIGNYIFLYEGWNLISIPYIQSNTNVGDVLSSINGSYKAVQWYNTMDDNDHWKHNCSLKPSHLNDFHDIDHTIGFWIYITEQGGISFEYFGIPPFENMIITLYPGWNLVGYPSSSNKTRTMALNNIIFEQDLNAIWTYDASTQTWDEIEEFDYFEVGRGYYINSKYERVWDVPP
ncbi:MAG: right-handed parallel beta-helix repeat-containing protein [Thermoplasmata archaeon]|nr:MAG: right-handed parallel beta-helix repeat-containing protein [Thermoplasmata archaeon]